MAQYTVFGGAGFIGRHLVKHLKQTAQDVFVPARNDSSFQSRDLGHVIYAAGVSADFRKHPYDTVNAHIALPAQVLERARFDSFLYLSSTRVYASRREGHETASLAVDSASASDLFNLSKLTGEYLCLTEANPRVRVARVSNVVGFDPDSNAFIYALIRGALKGCIEIHSPLDMARDYIHIDDVCELLLKIASGGTARLYNVASGRQTPHRELVESLIALTKCRLKADQNSEILNFPPTDNRQIVAEFGFTPRPVLASLETLLDQFAAHDEPR
jgi:nucleoside-diphosphate-sugar epimerase